MMEDWNKRKGRADKKITISEQEYFDLLREKARMNIAFYMLEDQEYAIKAINKQVIPIY